MKPKHEGIKCVDANPTLKAHMECDICKKEALGVCASSFSPMSFAICRECLDAHAEPINVFEYLYWMVGNRGEGLAPEVSSWKTFKDGAYIAWDDWKGEQDKLPVPDWVKQAGEETLQN